MRRVAGGCYFWRDALGWPLVWDQDDETAIRPPDGDGALLTFGGPPPVRRTERNRFRLALVADGDGDEEVVRLIGLGATPVAGSATDEGVVALADPDGNEFSLLFEPR